MLSLRIVIAAQIIAASTLAQTQTSTTDGKSFFDKENGRQGTTIFAQPKKDRLLIGLSPTTSSRNMKYSSKSYESEDSLSSRQIGVHASYGLTKEVSLGASIDSGKEESGGKTKSKQYNTTYESPSRIDDGLSDPNILVNLRRELKDRLHLVGGMNWSIKSGEKTYSTTERKGNRLSGGHSVGINLGFEQEVNSTTFGVRAMTILRDLRTQKSTESHETENSSGGHTYGGAGYIESRWGASQIGFMLLLSHSSANVYSSPDYHSYGNYFDQGTASTWATFGLANNLELVPQLNYTRILNESIRDLQIETQSQVSATLGIVFAM